MYYLSSFFFPFQCLPLFPEDMITFILQDLQQKILSCLRQMLSNNLLHQKVFVFNVMKDLQKMLLLNVFMYFEVSICQCLKGNLKL